MKIYKNKFGFTLIELLVVITIMWILATWWISVYTTQMQKARDSNRITDISSLQSAVEQFNQDKAQYPVSATDWTGSGVSIISFMPNLAQDPRHGSTCNGSLCLYAYKVQKTTTWITNGAYELSTAFENSWNVESKAADSVDGWNDPSRLEKGYEVNVVVTKIDTTVWFPSAETASSSADAIIWIYRSKDGKPLVNPITQK